MKHNNLHQITMISPHKQCHYTAVWFTAVNVWYKLEIKVTQICIPQ